MYDIIIIGGGPGGYIAAERAGFSGKKVLLIEKEELGGVCLNHGCVPTKSLLNSAKLYKQSKQSEKFGIEVEHSSFNFSSAMKWKNNVVSKMVGGISFLMKENGVDVVKGEGVLLPDKKVRVNNDVFDGKSVIIATGSSSVLPPIQGMDSPAVITSRELLNIDELPSSISIIGGGVIGLEFASFFSAVGVKVSVIEMMHEILPSMEEKIARIVRSEIKEIDFYLESKVTRIDSNKVFFSKEGKEISVTSDLILVAVGRKANTESFENAGIALDKGFVTVDDKMKTNIPDIYAVGDVTGRSMLAHSASRMGEVAVNNILGKRDHMRYHAIPRVVYTFPEAASCGLTEAEAEKLGYKVIAGIYQMKNNSRFYAESGDKRGMCKVVADAEYGTILGIHLAGGISSELIAAAAGIIEAELRIEEVREIVFPHPSLSEVIKDAVWQVK